MYSFTRSLYCWHATRKNLKSFKCCFLTSWIIFFSLKNKPFRSSKRILLRHNKVFLDITDARYSYLGQFQLLEYITFVWFCLLFIVPQFGPLQELFPIMHHGGGLVTKSFLTLCNPMDCSPPSSSVRGILQARIVEWVAIFFSRNRTQVSCPGGRFFTDWAMRVN